MEKTSHRRERGGRTYQKIFHGREKRDTVGEPRGRKETFGKVEEKKTAEKEKERRGCRLNAK